MAKIKQDPQKLRDFCDQLAGHVGYWQTSVVNLERHVTHLGRSWRDDQFDQFAREVMTLRGSLDKFAADTRQVTAELRQDAERLEAYHGIQPGGAA